VNGDDCESCGQYIGTGPGHPRKCNNCAPEGKWAWKRQQKQSRNKTEQDRIKKDLEKWCKKNQAELVVIAPWHLSIQRNGKRIDIFPNTNKWHHVTLNQRGKFKSLDDFLAGLIAEKPTLQNIG